MGSKNLNNSNGFSARVVDALRNAYRTIVERITGFYHSAKEALKRGEDPEFRPRVLDRPTFKRVVSIGAPLPGAYTGLIESYGTVAGEPPLSVEKEGWLNTLSEVMEEISVSPAEDVRDEVPADPLAIEPLAFAMEIDDDVTDGVSIAQWRIEESVAEESVEAVFVAESPIEEESTIEEPVTYRQSSIRMDSPLARVLSTPTGSGTGSAPSKNYVFDFDSWDDWDSPDADAEVEEVEDLVSEVPDMPAALVSMPPAYVITEADISMSSDEVDAVPHAMEASGDPTKHGYGDYAADSPVECGNAGGNVTVADLGAEDTSEMLEHGEVMLLAPPAMAPVFITIEDPVEMPVEAPVKKISYEGDFSGFFAMETPNEDAFPEAPIEASAIIEIKMPTETTPVGSDVAVADSMAGFESVTEAKERMSSPMAAIAAPAQIFALPMAFPMEPVAEIAFDAPAYEEASIAEDAPEPVAEDYGQNQRDTAAEAESRVIWVEPPESFGTVVAFGAKPADNGGTGVLFSFCKGFCEPEESVEDLSECYVPVPESVHACTPSTGFRLTL